MVWGCGEIRGVEDLVNNVGIMNAKKILSACDSPCKTILKKFRISRTEEWLKF